MGRFGDKYVTSIWCGGRLILDEQCFLYAPKIFAEQELTVSIGGDVNMAATNVNFRNSTIDFNGATLENFTGNISGNISGNINVDSISALVMTALAFFGNLYGNFDGLYVNAQDVIASGGLYGTLVTSQIQESIPMGGITVTGALNASTVGLHTGNVQGSIKTNLIQPQTGTTITLQATNTTVINNFNVTTGTTTLNGPVNINNTITTNGNIIVNATKRVKGNVEGNIFTNDIYSTFGNITVHSGAGALLVSNIYGDKIVSNEFFGTFYGNLIGNISAIDTNGNFSGTFVGASSGTFTGSMQGNIVGANATMDVVNANLVRTTTLQTDNIEGKANPFINFNEVLIFNENVIAQGNLLAANVIITNILSVNPLATIVASFSGSLETSTITEQTPLGGINVSGNLISSDFFIGDMIGGTIYAATIPSGRVVFTGTDGLLTSAATLTFNSGTNTLSTTNISASSAITTGTITASTNIATTTGNILINGSGKQLHVKGGTPTADFIGRATLVAGTVTINNTNIGSSDRIFVNRSSQNGSTAYGTYLTSISAGTSFTITAKKSDTTTETNDTSIVDYFIVRQT